MIRPRWRHCWRCHYVARRFSHRHRRHHFHRWFLRLGGHRRLLTLGYRTHSTILVKLVIVLEVLSICVVITVMFVFNLHFVGRLCDCIVLNSSSSSSCPWSSGYCNSQRRKRSGHKSCCDLKKKIERKEDKEKKKKRKIGKGQQRREKGEKMAVITIFYSFEAKTTNNFLLVN